MPSDNLALFLAGLKRVAPIIVGVVPFGMIAGLTAAQAGLSPLLALAMSALIFAGASQLITVQLIVAGTVPSVIVFTALMVNLRFAMYSASLAPYFRQLPTAWRWFLASFVTDQAYACCITRFSQDHDPGFVAGRHWYYLGTSMTMWVVWLLATFAGLMLGAGLPRSWSLEFAIPLIFMALLVPALRDRAAVIAALCGGTIAVLAGGLPYNLGLILGALAGVSAGLAAETLR